MIVSNVHFGCSVKALKKQTHAGMNKVIASPSLTNKCFYLSCLIPVNFQIESEELMGVSVNPAHYTRLVSENLYI